MIFIITFVMSINNKRIMKYSKLDEIEQEVQRMLIRLKAAKQRSGENNRVYDFKEQRFVDVPLEKSNCNNTKEAAAFKRSALDVKRILANL
jgi:hypothetical protein